MLSKETAKYLSQFDAEALATSSEYRKAVTKYRPKLFAIVYLTKHITDRNGKISFSDIHDEWYSHMLEWVKPVTEKRQWRHAYVAPRNCAKSTMWFLIAPLWAAAHNHLKFVAAFADSATQAEQHLQSFKSELENNVLLRLDFPELCTPKVRQRGTTVSDSKSDMQMKNGFIFQAKGIDAKNLGMKVENRRPDLIILDDIEPSAGNYSLYQMEQRLATLLQGILYLEEDARVVLAGTVTMDGSIVHQLVKTQTTSENPEAWITAQNIKCYYYPAIVINPDGTERSVWEEKFPIAFLQEHRKERDFALNYMNNPINAEGVYWTEENIVVKDLGAYTRTIICIDPAVSTKARSDFTGIAVISYDPANKDVYVRDTLKIKLELDDMKLKIRQLFNTYPEATVLVVETNQGGNTWKSLFTDIVEETGLKYYEKHNTVKKEIRATWLLNGYQTGHVFHSKEIPHLNTELLSFPTGIHDDQVDCVGLGYVFFSGADKKSGIVKPKTGGKELQYV